MASPSAVCAAPASSKRPLPPQLRDGDDRKRKPWPLISSSSYRSTRVTRSSKRAKRAKRAKQREKEAIERLNSIRNQVDVKDWDAKPLPFTWADLTAAADHLQVDDGFKITRKVIPLQEQRRLNPQVLSAMDQIILTSKNKMYRLAVANENVHRFSFLMDKCRQHLKLHRDYLSNAERIKHDTSVQELMKVVPKSFPLIDEREIKTLLKEARVMARVWYKKLLAYEFALYLPKCNFIGSMDTFKAILKKMRRDHYVHEKFGYLLTSKPSVLEDKLRFYFNFWKMSENEPNALDYYTCLINEEYLSAKINYQKLRHSLSYAFRTPYHFLADLEHKGSSSIQHPFLEITKMRTYFGGLQSIQRDIRLGAYTAYTVGYDSMGDSDPELGDQASESSESETESEVGNDDSDADSEA